MRNWKIYSASIEQNVVISEIGPNTYCAKSEDGVLYTDSELKILSGSKTPKQVHILKKLFKGEVVK